MAKYDELSDLAQTAAPAAEHTLAHEQIQTPPDAPRLTPDAVEAEGWSDGPHGELEAAPAGAPSPYRSAGTWVKGQSGNPNGRPPKGETFTDRIHQALAKVTKNNQGVSRTNSQAIAEHLVALAMSDEPHAVRAIELIADRTDGKVTIPINMAQVSLLIPADQDVQ